MAYHPEKLAWNLSDVHERLPLTAVKLSLFALSMMFFSACYAVPHYATSNTYKYMTIAERFVSCESENTWRTTTIGLCTFNVVVVGSTKTLSFHHALERIDDEHAPAVALVFVTRNMLGIRKSSHCMLMPRLAACTLQYGEP